MRVRNGALILAVVWVGSVAGTGWESAQAAVSRKTSRSSEVYQSSSLPNEVLGIDVHVGPNLANAHGYDESAVTGTGQRLGNRMGMMVGVGLELPLLTDLTFRPELNYIEKGIGLSERGTLPDFEAGAAASYEFDGSVRLSYIEIPLLVKYQVLPGSVRPNFMAGPSVGYMVGKGGSGTVRAGSGVNARSQVIDIPINDQFISDWDFGFQAGAGVDLDMAPRMSMLVGLRYSRSFTNVTKNAGADEAFKSHGWLLTAGIQF